VQRKSPAQELVELVGEQARRAVAAVRDPRAKALRRRRRARRATVLRSGIALTAGTVTAVIGSTPGLELAEVAAGTVTVLAAVRAVAAGVRLVRLHRSPLPPPEASPAELPPAGSAAREPMVRLAAAEAGLVELLAVLARPRHGVAVVASEALESTREALAEAAAALRGTAEAICAVERAMAGADRSALFAAVAALRRQLDDGVDEVCGLVTAAGAVVGAAGPAYRPAALADATDRLTGLAEGLRELSHRTS
jgi:hypothetical protein